MSEFNLEEYKTFVLQQVIGKALYKKADVTEQILEALFQFTLAPSTYLKDIIPSDSLSLKYKTIFDLTSKSNSTWLNNWFLNNFGYKCCSKCKEIKILDNYSTDSGSVDKLSCYCKYCSNKNKKAYREGNQDKIKDYNSFNADKIKEYHKAYRVANADKIKAYKLANADKRNAIQAKRRAKKIQATPAWLTKEQLEQILGFYTKAKRLEQETGIKHHVDHIVPLQGLNVSGLHVPWNLQILTAKENLKKSNK